MRIERWPSASRPPFGVLLAVVGLLPSDQLPTDPPTVSLPSLLSLPPPTSLTVMISHQTLKTFTSPSLCSPIPSELLAPPTILAHITIPATTHLTAPMMQSEAALGLTLSYAAQWLKYLPHAIYSYKFASEEKPGMRKVRGEERTEGGIREEVERKRSERKERREREKDRIRVEEGDGGVGDLFC